MIEVQGLRHCFGRREVLRDLTFSLEKGGFAFLTGPSGAGKSTLLRILHGSLPLQEGRAVAAGHDLAGLRPSKLHQLRRDVAMVFQDFKILPERSVADNVALPLVVRGTPAARIKRRVSSALTALRLTELANRPCAELAGGEQQRVAIARAVVAGPRLMLADEPTGNLDWDLSLRLLDILRQFSAHGTAILMATHNQALVAAAPDARIIRLERAAPDAGTDAAQAAAPEAAS
ncbi:cell division ATP-binding protein FtsE [Solidesulfovibrio magneticus]|uniref:Cell division ATP-binding protein FtsE n=1 Tax=Solidesulfovibrio magneticus (strain ATCC 700980 / DSM 13731 / RS-1) TaxID=573370 RepID=C4XTQ1_SOLM1|nr:ATP-binding cassette domain-containing protein [Solidesulfovibrio magneticus]BAH73566.1 putative cell division ATP-binding protein FtsE [Solidesulfovibrio magneticus RS-1]